MESKIPCPVHGSRYIKVQHFNSQNMANGEWHRCRRCDFKRWLRLNSFIIAVSALSLGVYVQNVLRYLQILS